MSRINIKQIRKIENCCHKIKSEENLDSAISYILDKLSQSPDARLAGVFNRLLTEHNLSANDRNYGAAPHYNIAPDILKSHFRNTSFWCDEEKSVTGLPGVNVHPVSDAYLSHLDIKEYCETKTQRSYRQRFTNHECCVYSIENGMAYCSGGTSTVVAGDQHIFSDLSSGPANLASVVTSQRKPYRISGNVAFICSLYLNNAFFHWLIEYIPRILMLGKAGFCISDIDAWIFPNEVVTDFARDTLEHLGIDKSRIFNADTLPYIAADNLIVPSQMSGSYGTTWCRESMKKAFLHNKTTVKTPKRIYISRNRGEKRTIINETALIGTLKKHNVEPVYFEELNIHEQIALVSNAELIVATHGAALSHLVFSNNNVRVLEIFSENYVNRCFQRILSHTDAIYTGVLGKPGESKKFNNRNGENIVVDVSQVSRAIDYLLSDQTLSV